VGQFQQPVGESRFAVVNVRDDAKIANVFHAGILAEFENVG